MPNCAECKESRQEITTITLPTIVYERDKERDHQDKRRLVILIIILIAALILSNLAWAIYENSFETVETAVTENFEAKAKDDSVAVITRQGSVSIGGSGEIYEDNYNPDAETQEWK